MRDDTGVYEGYVMPIHYDSLISKLISWGGSREEAIDRMRRALDEYLVEGLPTTISFLRRVMDHPEFLAGRLHTRFIEAMNGGPPAGAEGPDSTEDLAAIAVALAATGPRGSPAAEGTSAWSDRAGRSAWKLAGRRRQIEDRL